MPLLDFWNSNKDTVLSMTLDRIVTMCGDGTLADGNETSIELKKFLSEVDPEQLAAYAKFCLENRFNNSGYVLQDVINEIARRLDFTVRNGRYQGVRNDIGFDGIWANSNDNIVIEIKTTDAYLVDLDVIENYRQRLISANEIKPNSNCLIVVGRNEKQSKALEMQLRGSRHAWSMRIISIDALIKLMYVNATTTSSEITEKIYTILRPFEYVKVDQIVDVLFTAAEESNSEESNIVTSSNPTGTPALLDLENSKDLIVVKRTQGMQRLSEFLKITLVKRRKTSYADQSGDVHASISISKKYETSNPGYWYGYHTRQSEYLSQATKVGYMVFGMLDRKEFYAISYTDLERFKTNMDSTVVPGKDPYWHVRIFERSTELILKLNNGSEISLDQFKI
jgi:hypothetical protein